MKLIFLGTGAADWTPKYFIEGTEYRRLSSALIDGELLIDPGPFIFHFADSINSKDMFSNLKAIIITHSHPDHISSVTVERLCTETNCTLYGDSASYRKLQKELPKETLEKINFVTISKFDEFETAGFKILALPSNHATSDPEEITLNYSIEKCGKKLFYGPDGAWLLYSVWQRIKSAQFDAMILEATIGDVPGDERIFTHNSTAMLKIMLETIRTQGCIKENGKVYCTHMARTLHQNHKTLIKQLKPLDVTPAFDGMEIEI